MHGTEKQLQHCFARRHVERAEIRQDGCETLRVLREVIKPNERNVDEFED
ncbi:hypothetical protein [Paraburkholderia dioscoreae]|nr:hypothetical protein [Paraburkholderia dioscoreae]